MMEPVEISGFCGRSTGVCEGAGVTVRDDGDGVGGVGRVA